MKMVSLGDVAEVIAGQSPEGHYYNKDGEGIPFYQGKKEFGVKYIGSPTTWTTKITKLAEAGDILMSVRAPVGPINLSTERICIGRGLAAIRPAEGIRRDYLFYFLLNKQPDISGNAGAVFDSINKNQISSIQVPLPSIEKQQETVEKLDKVFAELDLLERNIELREQMANDLIESKLSDSFYRSVFNSEKSISLVGKKETFENVEVRKLSEMISIQNGYAFSSKKFVVNGGIPLIRIRDLKNGKSTQTNYLGEYDDSYLVNSGDLLIGMDGEFKCYEWQGDQALLNQRVCKIKSKSDLFDVRYLFYGINSFLKAIEEVTGYTTVKHLSSNTILNIDFPVPSVEMQKKIVENLDQIVSEIDDFKSNLIVSKNFVEMIRRSFLNDAFEQGIGILKDDSY
jgi:type I restriction enzyme S subunit